MNKLIKHVQTNDLPNFSLFTPDNITEALDYFIQQSLLDMSTMIDDITSGKVELYDSIMRSLHEEDHLSKLWNIVSHLKAVDDTVELRTVYTQSIPKMTALYTTIGQNVRLHDIYQKVKEDARWEAQSDEFKAAINQALRGFKHSGISLGVDDRERFNRILEEGTAHQMRFSENVSDYRKEYFYQVLSVDELMGVPDDVLESAQEEAKHRNVDGYALTLDVPIYNSVMTHCSNRKIRKDLFEAYVTQCTDKSKYDNTSVIAQIVENKKQKASLLGYNTYADYSLSTKMAGSSKEVLEFLNDTNSKIQNMVSDDKNDIVQYGGLINIDDVQPWDVPYINNKILTERYNVSSENIRKHFPVNKVVDGLFALVHKLFDLDIVKNNSAPTYHPDVSYYDVYDHGVPIAGFYFDLYLRDNKNGGAWMSECTSRIVNDDNIVVQTPIAFLTCNFSKPTSTAPCLLTHDDVTTLFHEFGHGLHHMLTKVNIASVAGISGVEWDAVELPSQFMENWCWNKDILKTLSENVDTNEPLSDDMIDNLIGVKNFRTAYALTRQIAMSVFDMRLYSEPVFDIHELAESVYASHLPFTLPEFYRTENTFNHIFGGGYSAGYYSYLWAELLSADVFGRFQEEGLFNKQVANDFRKHILEKGSTKSMSDLFTQFRSRPPTIDCFLESSGIANC